MMIKKNLVNLKNGIIVLMLIALVMPSVLAITSEYPPHYDQIYANQTNYKFTLDLTNFTLAVFSAGYAHNCMEYGDGRLCGIIRDQGPPGGDTLQNFFTISDILVPWNQSIMSDPAKIGYVWYAYYANATGAFSGFVPSYAGDNWDVYIEFNQTEWGWIPPVCSFDVNPTGGPEPLAVTFNDTSSNNPISWDWLIKDQDGFTVYTQNLMRNFTRILDYNHGATLPGVYDVRLEACNGAGCCNLTKENVIDVQEFSIPSNDTIIVNLDVKNAITGALIQNAAVGIRNTTSGEWRNSTAPTGLVYFDSTGAAFNEPLSINQTITLAASKPGYTPWSKTFAIPYHNYREYAYLMPDTVINETGKFTLIVTVTSQKNGIPISAAAVTLSDGQMRNTNSAGAANFYNVTAGNVTITASSSGYQTSEETITGVAGETRLTTISLVLNGETPVPTMIAPTATTTGGNITASSLNEKGASGLDQVIDIILSVWPLIFVLVLMRFLRDSLGGK